MSPTDDGPAVLAYRIPHVARCLDLSVRTVQRRIAEGDIRAIRIGGSVRIPAAELDRLLGRSARA